MSTSTDRCTFNELPVGCTYRFDGDPDLPRSLRIKKDDGQGYWMHNPDIGPIGHTSSAAYIIVEPPTKNILAQPQVPEPPKFILIRLHDNTWRIEGTFCDQESLIKAAKHIKTINSSSIVVLARAFATAENEIQIVDLDPSDVLRIE